MFVAEKFPKGTKGVKEGRPGISEESLAKEL